MVRRKTSIYVDRELWERFKLHALRRGLDVSVLLEDVMRDAMVDEVLDSALSELAGTENYELDFEPVRPEGVVSELVRVVRDERSGGISR